MKSIYYLLCTMMLFASAAPVFAQKYKSAADTGKLNVEYVKVQNKIADLTTKLADTQSGLPGYQTKATNAGNTAQTAAATSDASSSKATNGNLHDSKNAKNDADNSYSKAKDARSANNNVAKQNEKIRKLTAELNNQRQRLQDLDQMRAAINAELSANIDSKPIVKGLAGYHIPCLGIIRIFVDVHFSRGLNMDINIL